MVRRGCFAHASRRRWSEERFRWQVAAIDIEKVPVAFGSPLRAAWATSYTSVAFSPDGKHFVTGCEDYTSSLHTTKLNNKLAVWNSETAAQVRTLYKCVGSVVC